jgi:hypothetical protein
MTKSIAVVCEAPPDLETGGWLADRVILENLGEHVGGWISAETLDDFRRYRGLRTADAHLVWKDIEKLAKGEKVKPLLGPFTGYYPAHEDEWDILRALPLLLFHSPEPPDGIIFLRDTDDQDERRKGLLAARTAICRDASVPVVIGIAHTKRECWHLAGFEPDEATAETTRLGELRRELGFDPRTNSELLRGSGEMKLKSAKRILSILAADNQEREVVCIRVTPLDILRDRGASNGLTDYLADVKTYLLTLFR